MKIDLNFYCHTSLWCLKRLRSLRPAIKPFETPQKKYENKNLSYFFLFVRDQDGKDYAPITMASETCASLLRTETDTRKFCVDVFRDSIVAPTDACPLHKRFVKHHGTKFFPVC